MDLIFSQPELAKITVTNFMLQIIYYKYNEDCFTHPRCEHRCEWLPSQRVVRGWKVALQAVIEETLLDGRVYLFCMGANNDSPFSRRLLKRLDINTRYSHLAFGRFRPGERILIQVTRDEVRFSSDLNKPWVILCRFTVPVPWEGTLTSLKNEEIPDYRNMVVRELLTNAGCTDLCAMVFKDNSIPLDMIYREMNLLEHVPHSDGPYDPFVVNILSNLGVRPAQPAAGASGRDAPGEQEPGFLERLIDEVNAEADEEEGRDSGNASQVGEDEVDGDQSDEDVADEEEVAEDEDSDELDEADESMDEEEYFTDEDEGFGTDEDEEVEEEEYVEEEEVEEEEDEGELEDEEGGEAAPVEGEVVPEPESLEEDLDAVYQSDPDEEIMDQDHVDGQSLSKVARLESNRPAEDVGEVSVNDVSSSIPTSSHEQEEVSSSGQEVENELEFSGAEVAETCQITANRGASCRQPQLQTEESAATSQSSSRSLPADAEIAPIPALKIPASSSEGSESVATSISTLQAPTQVTVTSAFATNPMLDAILKCIRPEEVKRPRMAVAVEEVEPLQSFQGTVNLLQKMDEAVKTPGSTVTEASDNENVMTEAGNRSNEAASGSSSSREETSSRGEIISISVPAEENQASSIIRRIDSNSSRVRRHVRSGGRRTVRIIRHRDSLTGEITHQRYVIGEDGLSRETAINLE